MSATVANFLFEAANLIGLVAVLAWLFVKPLRGALDAEVARRAEAEKAAATKSTEAERLAARAHDEQGRFAQESERQRKEILDSARKEVETMRADAERARAARAAQLARDAQAEAREQGAAIADAAAVVVAQTVERLLAAIDGPALDGALVRAASERLRALGAEARRGATVESAHELDPASRKVLDDTLGDGWSLRLVRELGAGVRVTTRVGQIDASARAIAREAAEDLRGSAGAEREVISRV